MPSLPIDPTTGMLDPYTDDQIAAMDVRRRGMRDGGHVRYNFGPDGSGCARKFSCLWEQRYNTLFYFVGAVVSYIDVDTGLRKLSRMLPLVDPDFSNWICTKIEFEPFQYTGAIDEQVDGSEPLPGYNRIDFTATFEMVPYNLATDAAVALAYTGEQIRYTTAPGYPGADVSAEASYIGLSGSILQYATTTGMGVPAGVPIPYPVGFVEANTKFKVIWRRIPLEVWGPTAIMFMRLIGSETTRGYIGTVNQTAFMGYPPLQLQLLGIEQRLLPDATGLGYSWDLTYSFSQKVVPYGQLGFYYHDITGVPAGNPGTASGYYMVLRPAAGQTTIPDPTTIAANASLFPVNEFANLFVPGVA